MIPRLFAAVSIGHLGLCYIYVYFLYRGFGGDISSLFTASDVLNVGLGKIVPFYILFIPSLFFNHLWMIDEPFKIANRAEFSLHPQVGRSNLLFFWTMIALITPIAQFFAHYMGHPMLLIGVFFPLIIFFSWILSNIFKENSISDKYRLPSVLAFVGLLQISTGAYAQGFAARHREYDFFSDAPRLCGGNLKAVLTVGDYVIGVSPNGSRQAFSRDCKLLLTFETRKVVVDIFPI